MRHTYITKRATEVADSWTNREVMDFHYFNENGLIAKWEKMNETIGRLVDGGRVSTEWHWCYGVFSDHDYCTFIELHAKNRIRFFELCSRLRGLQSTIDRGNQKVRENLAITTQ